MHVYFIENENPTRNSSGGIMSYLINLSQYLEKNNVTTTLLFSGESNINNNGTPFSNLIQITSKSNASNIRYLISLFWKIKSLLIEKSSIFHVQRPDMALPIIIFWRHNKIVCTLHGAHDKAVYDKKGFLYGLIYSFIQRVSFQFINKLIVVDKITKDYYLNKYPWLNDKIIVIPTGVDINKFLPSDKSTCRSDLGLRENDKIVLFIGRLEKEKNIEFLIDSFSLVKKSIPDSMLLVVGDGSQKEILDSKVKSMNLDNVMFMGEVSNDEIPIFINCAEVFAICSSYEGSPIVIKEALACNLPVVSVDVGDVKEVIENIEGCYIIPRNISEFAKKIILVLNNNRNINSREKIFQFSSEKVGSSTYKIYSSLLKST